MKHSNTCYDGLITGSGPMAYLSALALNAAGYQVALLQTPQPISHSAQTGDTLNPPPFGKEGNPLPHPDRAIALNLASLNFLKKYGIWDELAPFLSDLKSIQIIKGHQTLAFNPLTWGFEKMGAFIPYQTLLLSLKQHAQHAAIPIFQGHMQLLANTTAELKVNLKTAAHSQILSSSWLLNNEGQKSALLDALQWERPSISNQVDAAFIAHVHINPGHRNIGQQCFVNKDVIALLPLSNPHEVSLVWSGPEDQIRNRATDPSRSWIAELQAHFQLQVSPLSSTAVFPLQRFLARAWVKERVILMGDSAHGLHPLAGQGLNQGIFDLSVFLNVMGTQKNTRPIADLQRQWARYQRKARAHALEWMSVIEAIQNYFSSTFIPDPLKTASLCFFNQLSPLKKHAINYAIGL